ncbi:MAG: zf-HC2 domain-containing protein [Acidobacteria bacterium]|nr:zf-HC2 domain-containing protein [Acidobacteriota bacterium]
MNCHFVQQAISAYMDGQLAEPVRRRLSEHLSSCRPCSEMSEQYARVKVSLGRLPARVPPAGLRLALRNMVSRELARRRGGGGIPARFGRWASSWQFRLDDLMRPLALPFAGGLVSAVLVFALFVPMFAVPGKGLVQDVPTMLFTEATVNTVADFDINEDEVLVDLVVDGQGRIVDYSAPNGQDWMRNVPLRQRLENALLFTNFTPSTMFGQPASTRVRLTIRRSQIDVKG